MISAWLVGRMHSYHQNNNPSELNILKIFIKPTKDTCMILPSLNFLSSEILFLYIFFPEHLCGST